MIVIAVITAVAVLLALGAAHCGPLRSGFDTSRLQQPVLVSLDSQFVVNIDQPHLDGRSAPLCHKAFAIAVLSPSPATALAGLGVVVAPVAVSGWLAQHVASAGRGPPRGSAAPLTGQDRLTWLCVARR